MKALFGRLSKPPQPLDQSAKLLEKLQEIDQKIERLWAAFEFIRTRTSSYLGDGIALTHLVDETPLFVNANDFGCPFCLINGGRWEEENLDVLLSFVKPDTAFLDLGANLGFFAVQLAKRIQHFGKVLAFEPQPAMAELLQRNVFVNGLTRVVTCFPFGLSDTNGEAVFSYPVGHRGGGTLGNFAGQPNWATVQSEIRRLDDVVDAAFTCDLVKIDVEGQELNALRGMRAIIARSPNIKILFEKLVANDGSEAGVEAYFADLGFDLYGIRGDASLLPLGANGLAPWGGYVLAARPGAIDDGLSRARFSIYPGQMFTPGAPARLIDVLELSGSTGQILFHGPYWFLRRGTWRVKFVGDITGIIRFVIQERVGFAVHAFELDATRRESVIVMPRDLVNFECVAVAATTPASLRVQRLDFIREG